MRFLHELSAGFWVCVAGLFCFPLHAQEVELPETLPGDFPEWVQWEELGESPYFDSADLLFSPNMGKRPTGVMLVAGAPEEFESLESLELWRRFARRSGWSMALAAIESPELTRVENDEAGQWLRQQIQRSVGKRISEMPVGEDESIASPISWFVYLSGPGVDRLLSSLLTEQFPVDVWVAHGGSQFPDVTKFPRVDLEADTPVAALPPGLVMGGPGKNRDGWELVHNLRTRDLRTPVVFQAYQGAGVGKDYFDELGRTFLKSARDANEDSVRWVRYETEEYLTEERLKKITDSDLARYHWFPDEEFLGAWKALSEQRPSEPDYLAKMYSKRFRKPPPYFSRVEFHHNRLGKEPRAIFLVAMDSKRPQTIFQSEQWVNFAKREGMALMVLNVTNGTRVRSHNQAAKWLGDRLFDYLEKGPYKDLPNIPIIWHGNGRPAYWMQRIMMDRLHRFAAWSSLGAPEYAVVPPGMELPPGLIVAANPDQHFPSLFFLQDVRKAHQSNRVCLIARDKSRINNQYIDEFAREFLAGATTRRKGNGFWLRYRDDKLLTLASSKQGVDPADYVWFPSKPVAGTWKLLSRTRPQIPFPTIKKFTIETSLEELPELNLFIRIPGVKNKEDQPEVRGVLCFCTWQREDNSLLNRLKKPDDPLVSFADRNKLAVITWNTAGMLPPGTSINSLDEDAEAELARKFDRVGESWLKGIEKVCRDNKLPDDSFLLHGVSRGSTYAHRLALRHPDKFLAVNTHIASHYEEPHEDATDVIWLVTTGEIDGGYRASREFFLKAQELGFPTLIKAGPSLGHSMRDDIELLSLTFFDYVLHLRDIAAQKRDNPEEEGDEKATAAQLFRERVETAQYFGDFINHEVYPKSEGDWVPEGQRILLPTEALANAWGAEPEKGL